MTHGYPKPRVRIIPVRSANQCVSLTDDDADTIYLEFIASISGAKVFLPSSASVGKKFALRMIKQSNISFTPSFESCSVVVKNTQRGASSGRSLTWILGWGQTAVFEYTCEGWVLPDSIDDSAGTLNVAGIAIGDAATAGGAGVAIGTNATGYTSGTALGLNSNANGNGAAVGRSANGFSSGAAVGEDATGSSGGAAIGNSASTNSKDAAVAVGYYSRAQRYREFVKGADKASTTLRSWSILDWYGDTANATPTEILLGGTASQRLTVLAKSAFMFSILVVARDDTNNVVSSWKLEGCIKRDASNNTALVGAVTKTVTAQDAGAAAWDIAATADDTNEALILTVTGAAATTIRWNAMATISEVRF